MFNNTPAAQSTRFDPDLSLVQRMATGHMPALDELYARHAPAILSFLVARLGDRTAAEEVLQDVMLAAWRGASGFRGDSSVRTWLLVIARNRAINTARRYQPSLVSLDEAYDTDGADTGPLEKFERKATAMTIREAINHLPAPQREVLLLVFYHQLSGPEVAHVLGINPGTVKSRLHRAKESLKRLLDTTGGF